MSSPTSHERPTAALLARIRDGDRSAAAELFGQVYSELHQLARRYMDRERSDHTLQPTALLHEAYLRLFQRQDLGWQSREHFLGMAAQAMRFVLVDHARARTTARRGGARTLKLLDEALDLYEERAIDILALDDALDALAEIDRELAQVVELRFFGGMTVDEVARAMSLSARTIERGWWTARAFLRHEMELGRKAPR